MIAEDIYEQFLIQLLLISLLYIQSIILKKEQMQTFITASDTPPSNTDQQPSDLKLRPIKQQIRLIIASMPSEEVCQQASINIGLPNNITHFQKLLKLINSENNLSSLHYTLNQLKILQKEAVKLKNKLHECQAEGKYKGNYVIRSNIRKPKSRVSQLEQASQEKKLAASNEKIRIACQEQLEARQKVRNMFSTDFLSRKNELVKKKVQTAKSMNKKALKIFKNYKERHQKQFQFFKIETIYEPAMKKTQNRTLFSQAKSRDLFMDQGEQKISLQERRIAQVKCMTAAVKVRQRYAKTEEQNSSSVFQFDRYRQKHSETMLKKGELQRVREQQAIERYIKKQQKIMDIRNKQNKGFQSISQSLKQLQPNTIINQIPSQNYTAFTADQVVLKCEEGQMKKDLQLQEKVHRLKQDLKAKQERRQRHRQRQFREKEETQKGLFDGVVRERKEQRDMRREKVIRGRMQQHKSKEKNNKLLFNLHKYSDFEIKRLIEEIRLGERKDLTASFQNK